MRKFLNIFFFFLCCSFTSDSIFFEKFRVDIYGDSITAGYNASPLTTGWAYVLGDYHPCSERVFGSPGQTISQGTDNPFHFTSLQSKIYYNDKLIFAWGVNDSWKSTWTKLDSAYMALFNYAVSVKNWARGDIVVITGYLVAPNQFWSKDHYDSTVVHLNALCSAQNVKYIDCRAYLQSNGGPQNISSDSVHPSTIGHTRIAQCIAPQL